MISFIRHFKDIAQKYPGNTAVEISGAAISYAELESRAAALSDSLMRHGAGKGCLVAISIMKSAEYLISMLAVWMAGAAFLPLDPGLPELRRRHMLQEARPMLLIARGNGIERLPEQKHYDDDLAYIIFTSGSSGDPKGVMVSHRGIVNVLREQIAFFHITSKSRIFFYISTGFDAAISDIGTAFLAGATLCLPAGNAVATAADLPATLAENKITHLDVPPSLLPLMELDRMPATLRTIIIGGETCPAEAVRRWAARFRLINVYGPTEATICTSMELCRENWTKAVIGTPLPGIRYHIGGDGFEAQAEITGELYISGPGLALGYIDPVLTAEKFVNLNGTRHYRTGDRVRRNSEGKYVYLGRTDRQIKLRGQLVAPEEIEAVINRHPLVVRSAVVGLTAGGSQKLCAVVEARGLTARALRHYMARYLPSWIVPAFIRMTGSLPVNANGKIDYGAVTALDCDYDEPGYTDAVATDYYESRLQVLWKNILGTAMLPSLDADFFDELGGDSFNVLELLLQAELQDIFLPPGLLFQLRTIRDLASWLRANHDDAPSEALPVSVLRREIEVRPPWPSLPEARGRGIFLTGCTGFLGIHVLAELLRQTGSTVTCLIRSSNEGEARGRLLKIAAWHRLGLDMDRIVILCGDLARPQLGLKPGEWENLCAQTAAIYHCAAAVNMLRPYEQFKDSDLSAVQEIANLAFTVTCKAVHYASTLSIFTASDADARVYAEDDDPERLQMLHGGYAQSKWAAEYYWKHNAPSGVRIYRFGLLTGDSKTGISSPNDYLGAVMKALRTTGSLPEGNWQSLRMDATPVDYAARAMVHLSLHPQADCYHIASARGFSLDMIVDSLARHGVPLKPCPVAGWGVDTVPNNATATARMALCRLLPGEYFRRYRAMDLFQATDRTFDCSNTLKALAGSGILCPEANIALLDKYVGRILHGQ